MVVHAVEVEARQRTVEVHNQIMLELWHLETFLPLV